MLEIFNKDRDFGSDEFWHTLGQRGRDNRGFEYIYVKAANDIAQNQTAVIDEDATASAITNANTDRGDRVGVALDTGIGSGRYGWLCIYGVGDISVGTSVAANANLYTSSTAGVLNDTATSQQRLQEIHLTTGTGSSAALAPAVWTYPYAD